MIVKTRAVLDQYPTRCRPGRIRHLGGAGGFSGAEFWRISAPTGELVLRRWPTEHPTPDRLRFIHAVLCHAADRGLDILPVPISAKDENSFVLGGGHLWELAPWLPGVADFNQDRDEAKLAAAMHALAQFHHATADFEAGSANRTAPGPAIVERLNRLRQLNRAERDLLWRHAGTSISSPLSGNAEAFLGLVAETLPQVTELLASLAETDFTLQPCIRDVWHDHVLFRGQRVTGLIDFGTMRVDLPAVDVARLLGSLANNDSLAWRSGLAAYHSICPLSNIERQAVIALDVAGIVLGGCNWLRWVVVERRVFAQQEKLVAQRFAALLERLASLRRFGPPLVA